MAKWIGSWWQHLPWKNRWITFAIGSVVLVLALSVLLAALSSPATAPPPNGAERLATRFYAAIEQHSYAAAYGMLAPSQQAELTQYAFTLFAQEQDNTSGPVTAYHEVRYDKDTNHANQGVVELSVTRGGKVTYIIHLTMVQTSGIWQILTEDRPI
jgi:hypothetical protein